MEVFECNVYTCGHLYRNRGCFFFYLLYRCSGIQKEKLYWNSVAALLKRWGLVLRLQRCWTNANGISSARKYFWLSPVAWTFLWSLLWHGYPVAEQWIVDPFSCTLSNVQNLQGVPVKSKVLNGAILWECFFGEMRHNIPECPLVKDSLTFPNLCAKAFYGYSPWGTQSAVLQRRGVWSKSWDRWRPSDVYYYSIKWFSSFAWEYVCLGFAGLRLEESFIYHAWNELEGYVASTDKRTMYLEIFKYHMWISVSLTMQNSA